MKRTDPTIEKKVIELYKTGLSVKVIGDILKINSVTAFTILKRNNIQTRTKGGIYRLNDAEIISRYQNGERAIDLAKEYNVHEKTIYNYLIANGIDRNYIYINRSLRRDYFHNIDSYDKAYFLGFMITDGCVLENNNVTLELKQSDYEILEKFREKTHNENPLYFNNRKDGRKFAEFHCKSKEMQNDLAKYGVVFRKSLIVKFPILENQNMMSHFIRGIIDGNGWISYGVKTQNIGLCSASKDFIYSFRDYLVKELNIFNSKINIQNRYPYSTMYNVCWHSKNDILTLGEYLYKDKQDCYLKRKWINYCEIKKRIERSKIYGNTEIIL